MADNEVSKLTWLAIAIALGSTVYGVAKPQITDISGKVFDKVGLIAGKSDFKDAADSFTTPASNVNESDSQWIVKLDYGQNGRLLMNKDHEGLIYAKDESKPIVVTTGSGSVFTQESISPMTKLTIAAKIKAYDSMSDFFGGTMGPQLSTIEGLTNLDTSDVVDMSDAFKGMNLINALDVSNFNTSKVTNMSGMFSYCTDLSTIKGLSHLNTSNVTNMSKMFFYGPNFENDVLKELDVSNFDTSKVTNMSDMFSGIHTLDTLDVSNFDTSKVTNMSGMFSDLGVTTLNLSTFDTTSITNLSNLTALITSNAQLTSIDLSNVNLSKITTGFNDDFFMMICFNPKLQTVKINNLVPLMDGPVGRILFNNGLSTAESDILESQFLPKIEGSPEPS